LRGSFGTLPGSSARPQLVVVCNSPRQATGCTRAANRVPRPHFSLGRARFTVAFRAGSAGMPVPRSGSAGGRSGRLARGSM